VQAVPFNDRPLDVSEARLLGPHSELTLGGTGGIFSAIGFNAGATDPFSTQSSAAIFNPQAGGTSVATFIIAIAGNDGSNEIGIYQYGNTGFMVPVFTGVETDISERAKAAITFYSSGAVVVEGVGLPSPGTVPFPTLYNGFGSEFGFYIKGPGGTYFTLDTDNEFDQAQALIYQGNDVDKLTIGGVTGLFSSSHWIFAFEDLLYSGSDKDFNDAVFLVESISPVPEPATMLLLGMGLIGLAGLGRKRLLKKS